MWLERGDVIALCDVHESLRAGRREILGAVKGKGELALEHAMSPRQIDLLLNGGVINWLRARLKV